MKVKNARRRGRKQGGVDGGVCTQSRGAQLKQDILDMLSDHRPREPGEIIDATGAPSSTVYRNLGALKKLGLVERAPGGRSYALAPRDGGEAAHLHYLRELRNALDETRRLAVDLRTAVAQLQRAGGVTLRAA